MHFQNLLSPMLLVAPHLASACGPLPRQEKEDANGGPTYPSFELGLDVPSDPATLGYFVNHLCINIKNVNESVDWYSRVFGLRLIFTQQVSEHFSITYMGHSAGGRNGTGFQTATEMNRDKNNRYGMLELVSTEGTGWDVQTTSNGLHHGGLIVPDIEAMQKRLDGIDGVEIVKAFGQAPSIDMPTYAGLAALDQAEQDAIFGAINESNLPLIFIKDPSGNVWEIQGQEGFGLG
ncbi:uncharacterized protein A1O9_08567 [Exophiala aquamarina CBS 119918]|uniref:VOC domain-containing protein n=1 Tax=Exophiala aquamarina CBS 119918 TaxID=1182545 RepID=A0A072P7L8_9EURO|nr:uncharacterized protein A1O9_08567 [Exophiala aquamarina CBS 119918]KEF55816.1 hypothetical protein A1O9_08567 [Exophiala aquamarina CBS 119918]